MVKWKKYLKWNNKPFNPLGSDSINNFRAKLDNWEFFRLELDRLEALEAEIKENRDKIKVMMAVRLFIKITHSGAKSL